MLVVQHQLICGASSPPVTAFVILLCKGDHGSGAIGQDMLDFSEYCQKAFEESLLNYVSSLN